LGKREFLDRVGAKRDHELMSAKKRWYETVGSWLSKW
jgi:hypothetical protein